MVRKAIAFLLAVLLATLWGSVVQTQFNLAALIELGATVSPYLRGHTTGQDLVRFGPLYLAVVGVTFLIAFPIAAKLSRGRNRVSWFALGGLVGLIAAIKLVDALVPPPVLIAATRDVVGLLSMTAGGALAGAIYAKLTQPR